MLEVRYNKNKEITGWWGSRFGNEEIKLNNRPDEKLVMLDIPIPQKVLGAYLFDGMTLIDNPDYIEPEPPRNLLAELDVLKVKIAQLEKL